VANVKKAKILIVDDHNEFRKLVSEYMMCLPNVIVVGEAVDGIDAIENTKNLNPDIVLMDISMPRCNGLEATRIIKEHWPLTKVIIATMHDNPLYRLEAERAQSDGFIVKSSLKSSLQTIVDQIVLSLTNVATIVPDKTESKVGDRENWYLTEQVLQEKAL
jgi:DNA-binding NarL/FixJ family response regulator